MMRIPDNVIGARGELIEAAYRLVFKPLFFAHDPELVHDRMTELGRRLGAHASGRQLVRTLFWYGHPMLEQDVCGIRFANPVGLAAGFDKNGLLPDILPDVGFGFAELGSVTGEPCVGNPKPRLWRLPKSEALVVYYGLKNDGAQVIAQRLTGRRFRIPLGISAAKTNCKETCETDNAITDYLKVVRLCGPLGDYLTINISCPNAYGGEPFTDPSLLDRLLTAIDAVDLEKPVFLKLAVDLTPEQMDAILEVIAGHDVHGLICSNLTKSRSNHHLADESIPPVGGISGKAVRELADEQVKYIYRRTKGRYAIMGVGGISSAEDAYRKIRLGASLTQLITGMIYRGPQLVGQINRGLVRFLERDGFSNMAEAVGVDNKA